MLVRFYKSLIKHGKIVFLATFCACAFFSFFALNLGVDASADSLLLENDKDLEFFREVSKDYKSDDFLMLAIEPKDANPFSSETLSILKALKADIEGVEGVRGILSILNAPLLKSSENGDLKDLLAHIPSLTSEGINLEKAKAEILKSPFYRDNIIAQSGKSTAFVIYLSTDYYYLNLLNEKANALNLEQKAQIQGKIEAYQEQLKNENKARLEAIRAVIERYKPQASGLYLGGVSMIADDMISYIKADLAVYGASLTLLLSLVLWLFFRKISLVLFTIFVCVASLGAASGIFALLGFKITVISSNYLALMLIITISLIIHLLTPFINLCKKYPRASIEHKVLNTLLAKSRPSFYAILTTAIGFLSLILSQIEPVIKLGIMMSVGISVSLLLSFLFLASLMPLLRGVKFKNEGGFKVNLLNFCAKFSLRRKKLIFAVSALCVIVSLFGIAKLRVENSFVNYFKDSSPIKQGLLVIDRDFGGTLPLEVVVSFNDKKGENLGKNGVKKAEFSEFNAQNLNKKGEFNAQISNDFDKNESSSNAELDSFESEFQALSENKIYWFNSQKTRIAKTIHEHLANNDYIGSVLSLNSLLELGKDLLGGQDLDDFTLAFLSENLPESFKQSLLDAYVNVEKNQLRFVMRIKDSDPNLKRDEFIGQLKSDIDELLAGENAAAQLTGLMLLYNNMLQSLFASQFNTLAFVVGVIFVLFVFVFRSVRYALVGILANVVPLSLVFALMGFANLPLDLMSITIAAICIGIGVDDSIHYIYNFKKELATRKSTARAIENSHFYIGQAFFQSKIAIILGFCTMISSNFMPTIYFGLLTVLVMVLLLIGSLLLLPSLLALKSTFEIGRN